MKGYNTIEELSLQQSYEILQKEENNPHIELIKQHYEQELERWHDEEKSDFHDCKSLHDYESFIARYQKFASFYKMQYKKSALDIIETLYWNDNNSSIKKCNLYLEKYPRGRYVREAQQKIKSVKKRRRIILISLFAVLCAVCIIAYKPAGELMVSPNSLSFSKHGGTAIVKLSTRANANNISSFVHNSWIKASEDGQNVRIVVDKNPNGERSSTVNIYTYSTFFGFVVSCSSKSVSIHQESGFATYMNVSKKSMRFDKYGNAKDGSKLVVKTDAVGYSITSPSKTVHVFDANGYDLTGNKERHKKEGTQSKSKIKSERNDELEFEISLDQNESGPHSEVVTITSGNFTEKISLYQESGLATYFGVDKTSIGTVAKSGTESGKCFRVEVSTDGMVYTTSTQKDWLHINQYVKHFEITVDANPGDVRTGNVFAFSNNGHKCTISITQDGNPTNFYLSRSSYTFDTWSGYEYFPITNNSIQAVSCYTYADSWLRPSIVGGDLKVECENNDGSSRDGTVYVKCGDKETKISIHQKGWKSCPYCSGGRKQCPRTYDSNHFWNATYNAICIHSTYYVPDPWTGMPFPQVNVSICPDCHGTGYVECGKCGGTGKIKTN